MSVYVICILKLTSVITGVSQVITGYNDCTCVERDRGEGGAVTVEGVLVQDSPETIHNRFEIEFAHAGL